MFINVFKVRAVWAVAGLVVLVGYLAAGGSFGSKNTILIEFGMYPEDFAGMQVEIDGEIAGTLTLGEETGQVMLIVDFIGERDGKPVIGFQ